jgi:muramoyltetrapeptide carboxypeptidase
VSFTMIDKNAMITPQFLVPGDTIGIVSTARKISTLELQPLLKLIENWGLKYVLGTTINTESNQYAGDDSARVEDLQQMFDDSSVKAIWCARGGYGTVRIIDQLDFSVFKQHPKWIIGYSDVTVLHSHIHKLGIETLHANMAIDIDNKTQDTRDSIKKVLFGRDYELKVASDNLLNRNGIAKGELVGGNLSLLYSLIGSPSEIKTAGKILFIEDLDEMLYHIDRMMQNLKRNGLLKNINGLIVGGMNDMKDNTIPFGKTAEEIVKEAVSNYNYPVCFDFPAGHIQDNRALILGREIELSITSENVLLSFNT